LKDLAYLCGKGSTWRSRSRRNRIRLRAVLVVALLAAAASAIYTLHPEKRIESALGRTFQIDRVDIKGCSHLSALDVQALSTLLKDQPIWKVSPKAVREHLSSYKWVESARVRRVFPSTLEIVVTERKPVAVVSLPESAYVDKRGVVLGEVGKDASSDLPLLEGLSPDEIRGRGSRFLTALSIARVLQNQESGQRVTVSGIRVTSSDSCWIRLEGEEVPILIDPARFDPERLRLCRYVLGDLRGQNAKVSHLDIRFDSQILAVKSGSKGAEARMAMEAG